MRPRLVDGGVFGQMLTLVVNINEEMASKTFSISLYFGDNFFSEIGCGVIPEEMESHAIHVWTAQCLSYLV